MKIPEKVFSKIKEEAVKNARFSWINGWEKKGGYIKSDLRGETVYGTFRIYINWEKKKEPTSEQISIEIEKYIQSLLKNEQHHQKQKEFRHYMLNTFFIDVKHLQHDVMLSILDNLEFIISLIEKSDEFCSPRIQDLHNSLKNLECGINDHNALEEILDRGRKRIGES